MNTKQIGDISELKAITWYKENDWEVLVPFGDNARFDFAGYWGGEFHRVQVKTGRVDGGVVKVDLTSTNYRNSETNHRKYTDREIDHFVVYAPSLDELVGFSPKEFGSAVSLRFQEPDKPDSNINWWSDYII